MKRIVILTSGREALTNLSSYSVHELPPSLSEGISNKETVMRKVAMLSAAALLMAGMTVACSEHVTRTERNVQEKTSYSSTARDSTGLVGEKRNDSTTIEQKQKTVTSDGMSENTTTRENSAVEKRRSETTSPSSDENPFGSNQEYQQQSETFHQHTRTEVTK